MKTVDGLRLSLKQRALLRPGELISTLPDTQHRLPRFFFEVPSWPSAHETLLTPHFKLAELMKVDCREARPLLDEFPHFVPCAIALLAQLLEQLRREFGGPIFVSANGGYRSPAHQLSDAEPIHCWGTAADIYRVGDTFLDDESSIRKFARLAAAFEPALGVKPFEPGDDHLHVDLGFATVAPSELSER